MVRAYEEPPSGKIGEAGAILASMARIEKSLSTDEPKVTTTVFDVNKPTLKQSGNVDLAKPKDSQPKKRTQRESRRGETQ
jgi:hypothetical protein